MRYNPLEKPGKQVRLDLKDKKILTALAQNARRPLAQIAKKVQLSRDTVSHRIHTYEKKGLIQGYKTIIDIKKFGFDNYHVFIQLNKPPREEERSIIKKFIAFPFTRAVLQFSGKYDFELAVIAPSVNIFEEMLETILTTCSRYLVDYEVFLITKTYRVGSFPSSFLAFEESPRKKEVSLCSLDEKDYAILKLLASNARLENRKIAVHVHISPDDIHYRLQKMINAGYIVNFIPAINYELIGYHTYAVLMDIRAFAKEQEALLKQFFKAEKSVLWAVKTIGEYNTIFYISTPDPKDVHKAISTLREYFPEHIQSYDVLMVSEEYVYNYLPEIIFQTKEKNK